MSSSFDRAVEYTDAGQLLGHLVMEVEMVNQKIAAIADFPPELAMLVKHLLVSHHGAYESVRPSCRKPSKPLYFIHWMISTARFKRFRICRRKEPGSKWTAFHRAYGRSFFKANARSEDSDGGA